MPTGQECFWDYEISLIQTDLVYQRGKMGLEQTVEEKIQKTREFREKKCVWGSCLKVLIIKMR